MFCQTDKARRYSLINYALVIAETLYLLLLLFLFSGFGLSKALASDVYRLSLPKPLVLPAYIFIIFFCYYILSFPFNFYHSFILEHQFKLSRQTVRTWSLDQLKGQVVSYVISLLCVWVFYFILDYQPRNWWWLLSLFWIFFTLIISRVAPVVIVPLFFKYTKVSDPGLRDRILRLADKMSIKILDVYNIDLSKKTVKVNAGLIGWGKTRRVILADSLARDYTLDEIEVILAHEFAHQKLAHLIKMVMIGTAAAILCFYIIFLSSGPVLKLFGYDSLSDISSLPVIIIYFVLYGIIMQPLENFFSRRFERSADKLAIRATGLKEAFISTMDKFATQNLSDRKPHPFIKLFFFDHPPIDERITTARSL
jgi:STE24 endopeptidase